MSPKQTLWTPDFIRAFASNILMFFAMYSLVPVFPFYVLSELKVTESVAGVLLSVFTIATLAIRPFSGYLVDTFARKPLYVLCYGVFMSLFVSYHFALTLTLFVIMRVLQGAAFGISSVSVNTIAVDILPTQQRGKGIGYFGMGANIAMSIGPMTGLFLYTSYSFHAAFWVSMIASILGFILAMTITAPKKIAQPAKEIMSLDRFFLIKGLPQFVVLATASFGYGVVTNYVGMYCNEMGFRESAGFFFTIVAVGVVAARALSANAINNGKDISLVYRGAASLIVGYSLFVLGHHEVIFYISALMVGLGYGFINPASQLIMINLAEHNRRGTANSTYYTAWDLGLVFGIMAGGNMIERCGFPTLFALCVATVVAGTIYFKLVAAPHFKKHKLR